MKTAGSLLLAAALVGLTACSQDESSEPKIETKPASSLQKRVDNARGQAEKPADDVKLGTEKATQDISAAATTATKAAGAAATTFADKTKAAVNAAKQTVPNLATTVNSEAQKLIEQAQSLLTEMKYPEALAALKSLGNTQLSPEQAGLVESLKAQLQKLLANPAVTDPAKTLGNLPSVPKQ